MAEGLYRTVRLKLTLPDSWPKEESGPLRLRAALPHGASLEAALSLGAPLDLERWSQEAVLGTVPPDAEAIFIPPGLSERETRSGWPFVLLLAELRELAEPEPEPESGPEPAEAGQGALLGYHLGAFYVFLAYAAEVHIRCPDRAAYQALEAALRKVLVSATVEWPDGAGASLATLCS